MRIAICGVGWCLPDIQPDATDDSERSIPGMVYQAVRACVADAGLSMEGIDAVVTASVDLWDGKTASNIAVTEVVGAVMKSETRIAGDGLLALIHGAMMVMSGHYQRVLVVAHGKQSETDVDAVSNWSFDPVYQQMLGLTDSQALTLQCQAMAARSAQVLGESQVQAAKPGDGACAVILEAATASGRDIVLQGFGYDLESHYLGDRDLADNKGLRRAADRAYAMAGIDCPETQIQRCYWSLQSVLQLPAAIEAARIATFEESLTTGDDTRHRLQWAGLPPFAAGLQRLIQAVLDLRENPTTDPVLVHGCHGPAGQLQAVCILKTAGGK